MSHLRKVKKMLLTPKQKKDGDKLGDFKIKMKIIPQKGRLS